MYQHIWQSYTRGVDDVYTTSGHGQAATIQLHCSAKPKDSICLIYCLLDLRDRIDQNQVFHSWSVIGQPHFPIGRLRLKPPIMSGIGIRMRRSRVGLQYTVQVDCIQGVTNLICDAGPTLNHHRVNMQCLLGEFSCQYLRGGQLPAVTQQLAFKPNAQL